MSDAKRSCLVAQLGTVTFDAAFDLQNRLLARRLAGQIEDILLLLEHPPTITVGKSGKLENILAANPELSTQGIAVFCTDRGGDVTYHGPGQLVGYPIMDLRPRGKDLHKYVRDLEEVIIRTLRDFSIYGSRDVTHPGVWIGNHEIAAIGIRVSRWITMHGFAINVKPNLEHFSLINPCGFRDRKATSMFEILGEEISLTAVTEKLIRHFSDVFEVEAITDRQLVGTVYGQ